MPSDTVCTRYRDVLTICSLKTPSTKAHAVEPSIK